ncbi:uncharacterized protein Z520_03295 [Fonsecaea multimorphosa CBS 102226]|uniref:Nephrocystin 3-like N-terminal domain-containing protein n=1 Tax=Fonsecaea multimorphosa CBS 102226 TaxID=1442371 RepID=A0A0D2IUB3_9EURO|nr:uncharacterized protein Z520_03295 [Fonsecaea multimorphosa CBS 102226]KIY00632.1 hypothetical protein Z520_03295 [Fonsecaea multimorphosa CBS 102226]OAL19022.1 hypothetical protein AYO22_10351 [Fonsecaea multimorphosa]
MLDPLSAIGLASAIVQFVDFGAEIIQGAREVYGSMSGATERNRSLEVVVSQMSNLISKLSAQGDSQQSEDEKALGRVADECKILAKQILDLLEKIKAKDPNSTLQAVWAALKNQKYRRERQELEGRLESCRNHLEFQLNYLTSIETKSSLDALLTSAEGLTEKFELFQKHVEQLRCGIRVTSISPEAQEQVRKLLQLSDEVLQSIKQQRVLNSLAYSDMETRFEEVSEEHSKTFEWIFEDTAQGDCLERDVSNQEPFVHWLSAGKGIFHISGKLGSGKSTLMKFLCNHPRTETELRHWAGDRKLIFAKFFFWRGAKTKEQKSPSGLVRSLLYEALRACSELIPVALPDLWAQLDSLAWQVDTKLDLGKLQTRAAIFRLINHRNLYREHCFCFFIDGLDEFEKTPQDGYGDLIQLLKSWSDVAPEAVKLCVSSREDLVFMDSFSQERRFRLQDLTKKDMQRYVWDKLPVAADGKGEELARKITERADGIFLWVALVVKAIRDQVDEGYELSDVEEELGRLPSELHELFEYLLESISSAGRKRAHRTFAMILKLRGYEFDLSLLAYSFLEDYERNPAFAMETLFPFSDMDATTRRSREDFARKRLYRDCRRLLEVDEDNRTITVTHRSILEFLESHAVKDEMKCNLDGPSTEDAISQLFLAEMRSKTEGFKEVFLGQVVCALIDMRNRSNIDQEPFRFLEVLNSTMTRYQWTEVPRSNRQLILSIPWQRTTRQLAFLTATFRALEYPFDKHGQLNDVVTLSTLHVASVCGVYEYVAWKIEHDPTLIKNTFEIGIIVCCATYVDDCLKDLLGKKMKILEFMLTQGLSANAIIHTCATNSNFNGELSFWQHFILRLAKIFDSKLDEVDRLKREFGEMIEKFLEYDADPYLWMSKP